MNPIKRSFENDFRFNEEPPTPVFSYPIIWRIFSFLNESEIRVIPCVCKRWKRLFQNYRKDYLPNYIRNLPQIPAPPPLNLQLTAPLNPPPLPELSPLQILIQKDVDLLIEIVKCIDEVITTSDDDQKLLSNLSEIGDLINQISWKEIEPACIRNKHGFRNRSKNGQNKLNHTGAKIDFERLSHLKDLAQDDEYHWLLTTDKELLHTWLLKLKHQIFVIFKEENQHLSQEQRNALNQSPLTIELSPENNNSFGLLVITSAYYHDLRCIRRLISSLERFTSDEFKDLNLTNQIDRYQLGYLFIQMGETAKELSDFIKPEWKIAQAEKNLLRFLFGKLGHYRQKIKDTPWIVTGKNIHQILAMKLALANVAEDLLKLLENLETSLIAFSDTEDPKDRLKNIIDLFALPPRDLKLAQKESNQNLEHFASKLESVQRELIVHITLSINCGTTDKGLKNTIGRKEKELSQAKQFLEQHESELAEKQPRLQSLQTQFGLKDGEVQTLISSDEESATSSSNQSSVLNEKDLGELKRLLFESTPAKKLKNLIESYDESALLEALDEKTISLLTQLAKMEHRNKILNQNGIKSFQMEAIKFTKSIDQAIKKLDRMDDNPNYAEWIARVRSNANDDYIEYTELRKDVDKYTKRISRLRKSVETIRAMLSMLNQLAGQADVAMAELNTRSVTGPQWQRQVIRSQSKHESTLLEMMQEGDFMQFLYLEIRGAALKKERSLHQKLVMAAKLSFAFYGQHYKYFHDNKHEGIKQNLLEHSILSGDCFTAMLMRHKQIAHNTFDCQEEDFHSTVEHKVVPWLNDFKYMARLAMEIPPSDEFEMSTLIENPLSTEYHDLSEHDRRLYSEFTDLSDLNRFHRSEEVLVKYRSLEADINRDTNPELATSIHWQAAFAYRNLGDFHKAIPVLSKALEQGKQTNNLEVIFGVYYGLYNAYIHISDVKLAGKTFEELELISSKSRDRRLIIETKLLLPSLEALKKRFQICRAQSELNFVKYYNELINTNPSSIIRILSFLTTIYLEDFEIRSALNTLEFEQQLINKYFHDFISKKGQSATYFKVMDMNSVASCLLLKFCLDPSHSTQRKKLEDCYNNIISSHLHRNDLIYFNKLNDINFLINLLKLSIFLDKTREEIEHTFKRLKFVDLKELNYCKIKQNRHYKTNKKEIIRFKKFILLIKKEISRYHRSYINKNEDHVHPNDKLLHKKKLKRFLKKIIAIFTKESINHFFADNYTESKKYIEKSLIYQIIIDYLSYDYKNKFHSPQKMKSTSPTAWINDTRITNQQLITYFGTTLQNSTQTSNCSLIERYHAAEKNPEALGKLITEYENMLLLAHFIEESPTIAMFNEEMSVSREVAYDKKWGWGVLIKTRVDNAS